MVFDLSGYDIYVDYGAYKSGPNYPADDWSCFSTFGYINFMFFFVLCKRLSVGYLLSWMATLMWFVFSGTWWFDHIYRSVGLEVYYEFVVYNRH